MNIDQKQLSSKMSKDLFRQNLKENGMIPKEHQFCFMSLENWKELITHVRSEYSQRLKLEHPTKEKGSLSWATITVDDSKNNAGPAQFRRMSNGKPRALNLNCQVVVYGQQDQEKINTNGNHPDVLKNNWPTVTVTEGDKISNNPNYGQLGLSNHPDVCGYKLERDKKSKSRAGEKMVDKNWQTPETQNHSGYQISSGKKILRLGSQVNKAWGTPRVSMAQDKQEDSGKCRIGEQVQSLEKVKKVLNPRWVETLMGVPIGWTLISCEKYNNKDIYATVDSRTDELRMLGNGVVIPTVCRAFQVLSNQLRINNENI